MAGVRDGDMGAIYIDSEEDATATGGIQKLSDTIEVALMYPQD